MTQTQVQALKEAVLSLLTDKNVKYIPTENDDERFGALMTLGYAFKEINKVFNTLESIIESK